MMGLYDPSVSSDQHVSSFVNTATVFTSAGTHCPSVNPGLTSGVPS